MKKIFSIICCAAAAAAITASALPAKRGVITVDQPDGSSINVQLIGDEFTHCYLSVDNHVLIPNEEGTLCYAEFNELGIPVASFIKATDIEKRTPRVKAFLSLLDRDAIKKAVLDMNGNPNVKRRALPQSGLGRYTGNFPTKGDIKGLVVLVEYTDVKFTTPDVANYFNRLLHEVGFKENGATGSAYDYFIDASSGQFRPQFDVYGPITLANKQSYYGGNDAWGNDKAPEDMVIEAVKALDSEVDFSQYDNDGDGFLDNVYVFYAGRGEADGGSANTVWPHSWDLTSAGKAFKVDGVKVDRYACSNEVIKYDNGKTGPDGIGTFVHEFSHVMGLPDLYHTTESVYYTPCNWSVMDYGPYNNQSRTPPTYSAYERNAMGWIEPILLDGPNTIELDNILESNTCCIIQTPKKNEFFLLENRQQVGWDIYNPGHGMLIWHIDYSKTVFDNNVVNNTRTHQYVDIEEANGNPDGSKMSVMAGWTFPGTSYVTSFTDDTKPSMKTWAGNGLNLPITDIEEDNGVIRFNVAGGLVKIAAPVALPAVCRDNEFDANWEAVDGATDYLLTVSLLVDGEGGSESANMGDGASLRLPSGWSASSTDVYRAAGYYGEAAPSLKISSDKGSLETRIFADPITKVSFWYRNATTSSTEVSLSTLEVQGSTDGSNWKTFNTITELCNVKNGANVTLDVPENVYAIRFLYNKATGGGNLALDDVNVVFGGKVPHVLPDYNGISTNGKTSYTVTNLVDAPASYRYTVCATNGTDVSRPSNAIDVDYTSGVNDIVIDGCNAVVTVSGREIHIDGIEGEANIAISDMSGRLIFVRKAANGSVTVPVNNHGIYIVNIDGQTAKVAL